MGVLDQLFGWVGTFIIWLSGWFPRPDVCDPTSRVVIHRWGKKTRVIGPGNDHTVSIPIAYDNANYIVELQIPAGSPLTHHTTLNKTTNQFTLRTAAALANGATVSISGVQKRPD